MTIQMQNPVSTELSHKAKIIILFVILLIFCIIGVIVYLKFSTDRYSAKIYDNTESVENLFVSNQESFTEIAYILKDSELFNYLYSIDRKSIFSPSIPKREKYLNEEEYEHICAFLNEYQPYEIGRTGGSIHFVFLCEKDDAILYYTEQEGEDLVDFLHYISQHSEIKAINDNWYFRVRSSDITRQ